MNVRQVVIDQIQTVGAQQGRKLAPLTDDLALVESGLDSLCLAILVARLEDELKFDPFSAADEAAIPVTIGDLVALYEGAVV